MKKVFKFIACAVLYIFVAGVTWGQDIQMSAQVNRNTVVLGETLTLEVSVSGNTTSIPNPVIPPMPGLSVNSSGRSQSISFVNGKVSSSIRFNYVIMPQSLGKHTIQPIKLKLGGKVYETLPILIEVTKSPAVPAQPGSSSAPQVQVKKESLPKTESSKNVFVKASLDKKTAYVGEQVTYIFKFYRRIRLIGDAQFSPPEIVGFVKEDLPPQKNYYADVDKTRFMVSEIRMALFPTSPGTFTIGHSSLKVTVPVNVRDPFMGDDFFGTIFGARGKTQVLKTNQLKLNVLPFPQENKPASFEGAIGSFTIQASADMYELKVGDPLTVSVTIAGSGNIKSITEPRLGDIPGFRTYDTVSSLNSEVQDYRITGSKVFQTVLVPEVSGAQILPPLEFSFFHARSKNYKVIKANPLSITVLPGDKKTASSSAVQGAGIKMIDQDIRFIKIQEMHRIKPQVIGRSFWISGLIILIIVLGLVVFEQYRRKLAQDIGWARSHQALRTARSKLSRASVYLKHGKNKDFYAILSETVTGYIADKMNISAAGLIFREMSGRLSAHKLDHNLIGSIKNLLEQCDFARFTSSHVGEDEKKNLFDETRRIISGLSRVLK